MSSSRSSKLVDYSGQTSKDQFVRTDHSLLRLRLRRRLLWREWRQHTDEYTAGELLDKVSALCTSIPSLKSRFARTHVLKYERVRGLLIPRWQALSPLHHAQFWMQLDIHLANVYWLSGSSRKFRFIIERGGFTWPEEFHNMLTILQQRLPISHRCILMRFRGLSVARMTDDLTKKFALFGEIWIPRLEFLARYEPEAFLSVGAVPRNYIPKKWYNEADGRDPNEPGNIARRHKDLGGAILTAFFDTRRDFPFAGMESSLAARTADSATGAVVQVASDITRVGPSDDLLTPQSLNSIGVFESDSEEWDERRFAHWRQHYGQGRSRTWRYRLYVKATRAQVTALAGKPRPGYLCVTFGPTARLPITVDRPSNALVTDWKLGKRRRTVRRHHNNEALFSNEAHPSLRGVEPHLYEPHESPNPGDEAGCSWCVPISKNAEKPLALPYENFIGAFLAPTYRVLRFLRHESHGDVCVVESFLLPTAVYEAKIYKGKARSRKAYKYRVLDVKRLRKSVAHVETIHQPGRKLIISIAEARALEEPRKAQSLPRAGSPGFELAFPALLGTRATGISSTLEEAARFYRLKALRAALISCLGEVKVLSRNGPNGSTRHCTTPVRTYVEQHKAAEKTGMPIKHKTTHRMESKRLRQQAYRQKKHQRKNEHAEFSKVSCKL